LLWLLTAGSHAQAPEGQYEVANGIVTDVKTQLHWQQQADPTLRHRADAVMHCATLDLNGQGWRVPTMKEIQTLVDETVTNPAMDTMVFPGLAASCYWSSSLMTDGALYGWVLRSTEGGVESVGMNVNCAVRCVR